jgi:ankyrin repeat protein
MKYIKIALGSVTLLIILYLAAIFWAVLSEDKIDYLVIDATFGARDFKYGTGYLIPPLARERLKFINSCPRFEYGNNAIGFITSVHADDGANKNAALEVARDFIRVGCSINTYDRHGFTPLHSAILFNDPVMVGFLIKYGANPQLPIRPLNLPNHQTHVRSEVGLNAYEYAEWLQSHSRVKLNMRDVIAALHDKPVASPAGS